MDAQIFSFRPHLVPLIRSDLPICVVKIFFGEFTRQLKEFDTYFVVRVFSEPVMTSKTAKNT